MLSCTAFSPPCAASVTASALSACSFTPRSHHHSRFHSAALPSHALRTQHHHRHHHRHHYHQHYHHSRIVPTAITKHAAKNAHSISPLPAPGQCYYDFSSHAVDALRVTHCRLLSDDLATHVYNTVRKGRATLSDLATMLSTCELTKANAGDTGWFSLASPNEDVERVAAESALHDQFLKAALNARPGALQKACFGDTWEVFVVTDVRHGFTPSLLGRSRAAGVPVNGNMKRTSVKKPRIDPNSYYIETFGCQMNASDSERMAAELNAHGYHAIPDANRSSLYIVNTCALRDHAEQKVYSYLGPQAQRKWDAPEEVTLMVTGCVAQQEGDKLLARVPEVDIVMGPQYANRISDVLNEFKSRKAQVVAVDPIHIQEDISKPKRTSKVTAWVNVIYGCLERCTYCVVPNTRGLEQSRSIEGIVREVEQVAADGMKEVVLLGQNVDAYGRDLFPKVTLSDLLRRVHEVDGIERIRFTTGHPRYISDELIETVYSLPKVMEHFHIPPQSGDNQVLREMRRGYSRERYMEIARRVRQRMPDASICADMIVGFPGETDEAFENSVRLVDEVVFDANMVRAYSARPNTAAASREDQVDDETKMKRLHILNRKMREQAERRSKRYLGRTVEVLVEGRNEKVRDKVEMMGRERTNRVVFFEATEDLVGKVVVVRVNEAYAFSLRGEIQPVVASTEDIDN